MLPLAVSILVELFTSQGCSSCPPADRVLAQLDQQPLPGIEFVVLSEHVDYWNRLGWNDPYSSAALTDRQQRYGQRFFLDGVYTPQAVVHGQTQLVGSDSAKLLAAARQAAAKPQISLTITDFERANGSIKGRIAGAIPPKTTLFAALAFDPAPTAVPRGENSGRQLAHVAVVRRLVNLHPSGNFDLEDLPGSTSSSKRPTKAKSSAQSNAASINS